MDNFNYDKTKENELNEDEFVKFWADLYALFEKIDKDGDGEIAVVECVALLDDKAEKFGLTKGGKLFTFFVCAKRFSATAWHGWAKVFKKNLF